MTGRSKDEGTKPKHLPKLMKNFYYFALGLQRNDYRSKFAGGNRREPLETKELAYSPSSYKEYNLIKLSFESFLSYMKLSYIQ